MSSANRTFVDLFAGCGGLALGLMQAGWRGLFAIEKSPMAFETVKANLLSGADHARGVTLDWPDYLPKKAISVEDLLDGDLQGRMGELEGQLDLVSGGPPCQGFSFSGRRRRHDIRNRLVEAYAEFVLRVRPKLLLMENVPGIVVPHGKKLRQIANPRGVGRPAKSYAQRLADRLRDVYLFQSEVVDAAEFGVPQHRKRFFAVGILRTALPAGIGVLNNQAWSNENDGRTHDPRLDPFRVLRDIRSRFLRDHGLNPEHSITAAEAIGDCVPGDEDVTRSCTDPQSPKGFREIDYVPPPPDRAMSRDLLKFGGGSHPFTQPAVPRPVSRPARRWPAGRPEAWAGRGGP